MQFWRYQSPNEDNVGAASVQQIQKKTSKYMCIACIMCQWAHIGDDHICEGDSGQWNTYPI